MSFLPRPWLVISFFLFLHCLHSARPAASLNLMLCNIVKPAINKNTKRMWPRCVWTQLLYSHVCLLAHLPSEGENILSISKRIPEKLGRMTPWQERTSTHPTLGGMKAQKVTSSDFSLRAANMHKFSSLWYGRVFLSHHLYGLLELAHRIPMRVVLN
jgi:hypothetical protein